MRVRLVHLADLGLHHELDVHAQLAERAADQPEERAHLGDVVPDRVPGDDRLLQPQLGAQAGLGFHRAFLQGRQRAGGPRELADEHAVLQLREALAVALDGREQSGHLVAEGHRNRLLQVAAADHRRVAVRLRVARHRPRDRRQLALDDGKPLADLQHGGGVGDVLRRRAPVAILAELVAAQRVQLRHHAEDRIADALGLLPQLGHVDLVEPAVAHDLVGRVLRDQAEAALNLGERRLDVEIFLRAVLVGPHVAHVVAGEDALEDDGVDEGGRHGGSS